MVNDDGAHGLNCQECSGAISEFCDDFFLRYV